MKVRGSLKIAKDLILKGLSGVLPKRGAMLTSDNLGKLEWSNLFLSEIASTEIYKDLGSMVRLNNRVFYSIIANASGADINNTAIWSEIGSNFLAEMIKNSFVPGTLLVVNDQGNGLEKLYLSSDFLVSIVEGKKTIYLSSSETTADISFSAPISLLATPSPSGAVAFAWTPAADDTAVSGYLLQGTLISNSNWEADDIIQKQVSNVVSNVYTGIPDGSYKFRVRAIDVFNNVSAVNGIEESVEISDQIAPTIPQLLRVISKDGFELGLDWNLSIDNSLTILYELQYKMSVDIADWDDSAITTTVSTASIEQVLTLSQDGTYTFRVRAIDLSGNSSLYSSTLTLDIDELNDNMILVPTIPLNIQSAAIFDEVTVTWDASTDDVEVVNYDISYTTINDLDWSEETIIVEAALFHVITLPLGSYKFRVRARDNFSNLSDWSSISPVTVENTSSYDTVIYYGQSVALPTENILLPLNAGNKTIETSDYLINIIGISDDISFESPYRGGAFEETAYNHQVTHFFALPDNVQLLSSYNSAFSSDVFYNQSSNRYTLSNISINNENYVLYSYVSDGIPVGQPITVSVNFIEGLV
jgi:hypothetical protein